MSVADISKSSAAAASLLASARPGRVVVILGYNAKGSAQFIQLHDAAAVPADAAVPVAVITVPASSNFQIPLPEVGIECQNGVVICNSSTYATKTAGSADCFFTAVVIGSAMPAADVESGAAAALLLEDGSYLLLEDGGKILLE